VKNRFCYGKIGKIVTLREEEGRGEIYLSERSANSGYRGDALYAFGMGA